MATRMLTDVLAEAGPAAVDWPEWVRVASRGQRRMLLSCRDGATVFSGTYLTDDALLTAMTRPPMVLTDAGFALGGASAFGARTTCSSSAS